ncbi:DUF1232 domain-containing protein [Allostreptomyces psammosilenae]|uniref:Uncharacterized membrane protein YkvA (DUF1232 family) n=1 Tax=Allostreptomyces psammosilenae TaxID=1892865 RepID=A0A852ZMQ2_9ACTN|nr:YkvA family protein [Allostreptomyces psammosilenae]NYI03679.1 uncharacterized membrane protein YkvA (DUF1232 family) [Allostreptomyces psammosilenae]
MDWETVGVVGAVVVAVAALLLVAAVVVAVRFRRSENGRRVAAALAGGAYLASPLDLVPDVLVPLGLSDDVAVVVLVIAYLLRARSARAARRESPAGE